MKAIRDSGKTPEQWSLKDLKVMLRHKMPSGSPKSKKKPEMLQQYLAVQDAESDADAPTAEDVNHGCPNCAQTLVFEMKEDNFCDQCNPDGNDAYSGTDYRCEDCAYDLCKACYIMQGVNVEEEADTVDAIEIGATGSPTDSGGDSE